MALGPYSPIYVVPGATTVPTIKIYKDAGLTLLLNAIPKTTIVDIVPSFNNTPGDVYPYPALTRVSIRMNDGSEENFELQNVANQATWNLGTEAALTAAVNDIAASLP